MSSRYRLKFVFFVFGLIVCQFTSAGIEPMLKTQTSWDGAGFSYPEGTAELTAVKLTLPEGEITPMHCHPVPTFGYISKGAVKVTTDDGKTTVLREGEAAVEVMNTVHRGEAVEGPLEIIVFYAGAEGITTTLKPEQCAELKSESTN